MKAPDHVIRATVISDITAERRRQIEAEGWTPEHDDEHDRDLALPRAAACYALAISGASGPFWITHLQTPQQVWPHRWEWKPKDRRANLVRAAALLIAELERLDRAAASVDRSPKGEPGYLAEIIETGSLAYLRLALADAALASVDTHPKDGDVQQAPLGSGAVAKPDAQGESA